MTNTPEYLWPDLKPVIRQYVVRDDQGRYGIAYQDNCYHKDTLFAHPINVMPTIQSDGAIYMTDTAFAMRDGTYKGTWYDYDKTGLIPASDLRTLTIVDDLGYVISDKMAEIALAGSEKMGHWNYGATLGKVGGKPPVPGQTGNEMTAKEAESYSGEVGEPVTERAVRLAASRGDIPGARKIGRDWLIPYDGYNHYLDNRPKPGPKKAK